MAREGLRVFHLMEDGITAGMQSSKQGEPVKGTPSDMGILSARDDRSSRRLVRAPAKHVRDGYGLI